VSRQWQYLLVSDTSDSSRRDRDLGDGPGSVLLQRTVADWSIEQELRRDGSWVGGGHLTEIKLRGAMYWTEDIPLERAREIVRQWVDAGHVNGAARVDADLPPELDRMLTDDDDVDAKAESLRTGAAADNASREHALSTLLDGPADLTDHWVRAEPGRLAVPAFSAWFTDAADAGRQAAAVRQLCETALVVLVAPDLGVRVDQLPAGVSVPADAQWLRAADRLYLTMLPRLLTTPGLEGAVLNGDDYDVVGGSRSFVEAVLGHSVEQAWAEFLEFARGDGFVPPNRDLTDVVARYRPYVQECP
jgi:hypothetical protein